MSNAASLRSQLRSGKLVVAPGAIDGITARAIERAGFAAAYMTGAGTSMTLGYPDYGLITMTEMVANATRIVNSISIPLISDADTGYGNELNVFRTVQEFERAGVAAIHIEDQVFPKRCGHLDNKEVVSREDYVAKSGNVGGFMDVIARLSGRSAECTRRLTEVAGPAGRTLLADLQGGRAWGVCLGASRSSQAGFSSRVESAGECGKDCGRQVEPATCPSQGAKTGIRQIARTHVRSPPESQADAACDSGTSHQ